MIQPQFIDWLRSTDALQRNSYGLSPSELRSEERAEYARWNILAATDELHEALQELTWKPWGTEQGDFIDRDAFVQELIDALHFCANLLVMAGCTDGELSERYHAKQQVNAARQASGAYTGVKEKCPNCKRDLLETGVLIENVGRSCRGCGQYLGLVAT